jgi:hypothetical protein
MNGNRETERPGSAPGVLPPQGPEPGTGLVALTHDVTGPFPGAILAKSAQPG